MQGKRSPASQAPFVPRRAPTKSNNDLLTHSPILPPIPPAQTQMLGFAHLVPSQPPVDCCTLTPSSSTRGVRLCQHALDDDVRSPCSFSPFPPMCAALSSPCCATTGISSTPARLPSDDIAIAAADTYYDCSFRYCVPSPPSCSPSPDSSSCSSSSTPSNSQWHLQLLRVMMVVAAAVAGGCSGG